MRRFAVLSAVALLGACGDSGPSNDVPADVEIVEPDAAPKFGESGPERAQREAADRAAGVGSYWVSGDVATEHSSPGGAVVNRVYYRQKLTAYERRDGWVRTTQDGFTPRWTRLSQLTDTQPPEKPAYAGPADYADDRIMPDAIPNPGEDGLTRADIDIIRKGAKMVLQTRPDCAQIELGDKSVSRANTYYVMCSVNGSVENVFFTRAEVEAATVRR
jgi:hypothetical protein|nr:hypothetical protein [uncultured Brevundimonas sp.]